MTLSRQNHRWLLLLLTPNVFLIILLLHTTGVGGANFTVVNNCSEAIWAVVNTYSSSESVGLGDKIPSGRSLAFEKPDEWNGGVWARTGCTSNNSSCVTGGNMSAVTLAEFGLQSPTNLYDVSLVVGFNLPLVVEPRGRAIGCKPTGCINDINQVCPLELRTHGGAACQSPCDFYKTTEYCCSASLESCGPTAISRLFKEVCPKAFSYPTDYATSLFNCTHPADYFITFCPSNHSLLATPMPPPRSPPPPPPPPPRAPPQQRISQPTKGRTSAKQIVTMVSVGTSVVIVLLSIAACVFFLRHYQNRPNPDVENLLLQNGSLAPKRYRYSEIKKITKSLSDKLGQGGFGSVYKGTLPDGRLVAVKILSDQIDSDGEEFVNEVASISRTSHVNIVTLLGFCYEGNKRALVYEYMPNKSLDKFLGELDLKKIYEIAVGIAKGLEYLHTGCITRIVHFDIKPQNILLDGDLCPKISDFGLAKLCKKKQSVLSVLGTRGTVGYIAPEVFSRNFGGVSHKSDVYSYGMMLLEMGGARQNAGTIVIQSNSENYFPDKIYEQLLQVDVTNNLDEVMIDEEEEERRRKMLLIGFWCIQTIPSDRPSISKVVEMLEGSLQSIEIPPKPFLFSPVVQHHETSSSSAHVETQNLHKD